MSFSSGAYFGSHSTASQCARSARAARRLAGVDWAVIEYEDDGSPHLARPRSPMPVDLRRQSDEVGAALGSAGLDQKVAPGPVEDTEQGHLGRLPRRGSPQIGALLRPDVREIGALLRPDVREIGALLRPDVREIGALLRPDVREIGMSSASDSSPNSSTMSPTSACAFSSFRRSPARSTASASGRPVSR